MQRIASRILLWHANLRVHVRLRTNVTAKRVRRLLGPLSEQVEVLQRYGHPAKGARPGFYLRFHPDVTLAQVRKVLSFPGEQDDG